MRRLEPQEVVSCFISALSSYSPPESGRTIDEIFSDPFWCTRHQDIKDLNLIQKALIGELRTQIRRHVMTEPDIDSGWCSWVWDSKNSWKPTSFSTRPEEIYIRPDLSMDLYELEFTLLTNEVLSPLTYFDSSRYTEYEKVLIENYLDPPSSESSALYVQEIRAINSRLRALVS